jgi:hypothetical protein
MSTMSQTLDEVNKEARKCLDRTDAYKAIHLCANSDKGDLLLYKAGVKTLGLDNPIMSYVPWVVVNGECVFLNIIKLELLMIKSLI